MPGFTRTLSERPPRLYSQEGRDQQRHTRGRHSWSALYPRHTSLQCQVIDERPEIETSGEPHSFKPVSMSRWHESGCVASAPNEPSPLSSPSSECSQNTTFDPIDGGTDKEVVSVSKRTAVAQYRMLSRLVQPPVPNYSPRPSIEQTHSKDLSDIPGPQLQFIKRPISLASDDISPVSLGSRWFPRIGPDELDLQEALLFDPIAISNPNKLHLPMPKDGPCADSLEPPRRLNGWSSLAPGKKRRSSFTVLRARKLPTPYIDINTLRMSTPTFNVLRTASMQRRKLRENQIPLSIAPSQAYKVVPRNQITLAELPAEKKNSLESIVEIQDCNRQPDVFMSGALPPTAMEIHNTVRTAEAERPSPARALSFHGRVTVDPSLPSQTTHVMSAAQPDATRLTLSTTPTQAKEVPLATHGPTIPPRRYPRYPRSKSDITSPRLSSLAQLRRQRSNRLSVRRQASKSSSSNSSARSLNLSKVPKTTSVPTRFPSLSLSRDGAGAWTAPPANLTQHVTALPTSETEIRSVLPLMPPPSTPPSPKSPKRSPLLTFEETIAQGSRSSPRHSVSSSSRTPRPSLFSFEEMIARTTPPSPPSVSSSPKWGNPQLAFGEMIIAHEDINMVERDGVLYEFVEGCALTC